MLIIAFHNDGTGNNRIANYDYTVYVNTSIIDSGRIEKHDRTCGWEGLLRDLLDDRDREIEASSQSPKNTK